MAESKRKDIMEHSRADEFVCEGQNAWLKERLEWFSGLNFGFFIHWGIYSQRDCIESGTLVEKDTWAMPDNLKCWTERGKDFERFTRVYRALNTTFNPVDFNSDFRAEIAAAGKGYKNGLYSLHGARSPARIHYGKPYGRRRI